MNLSASGVAVFGNSSYMLYSPIRRVLSDLGVGLMAVPTPMKVVTDDYYMCLNLENSSASDGAPLILYSCENTLNNFWRVESRYDGYQMRSYWSARCVNIPNSSTADNVQLVQYNCDPWTTNMNWQFNAVNGVRFDLHA